MPDGLAELTREIGLVAVVSLAVLYFIMRDRRNNKAGNPGPNTVWQQEMKAAQNEANKTLEEIKEGMAEACRLLAIMEDRQQRERP